MADGKITGVVKVSGIPNREYPFYSGGYNFTPAIEEQVISTKNKTMLQNIKVNSIPCQEEINSSGGRTITIGGY